jgi:hypothetical protein
MDYKKLETASKIYKDIKEVDGQIVILEKLAMLAAGGDIKASFKLRIEDLKAESEVKEPAIGVENPFERLSSMFAFPHISIDGYGKSEKTKKGMHNLEADITDTATLNILGVLLCQKLDQRKVLTNKLKRLGVTV